MVRKIGRVVASLAILTVIFLIGFLYFSGSNVPEFGYFLLIPSFLSGISAIVIWFWGWNTDESRLRARAEIEFASGNIQKAMKYY